jgi:signal transduction histidine kinase/CheY-like chemotaxis protein
MRWLRTLPLKTLVPLAFLTSGFLLIVLFYAFVLPVVTRSISDFNKRQAEALTQVEQGQLITLLALNDPTEISRVIFFASSDPSVKRMAIADENGEIKYASRSRLIGRSLDSMLLKYAVDTSKPSLKTGEISIVTLEDTPGTVVAYASLPFESNGQLKEWILVSVLDYGQIISTTEDLIIYPSNILALFFVIAGFVTAVILRTKLNRRLLPLVESARKVAEGEKGVQTNLGGLDEFAELSHAFDDMLAQIERQQHELEETIENARASSEAKAAFLSSLSHQVRTPLANVIGFLELLQEEAPNSDSSLYIRSALASANTLLGVIEDILEFSRFERGEALVIHETFCLNILTEEIVQSFLPLVQERNLDIEVTSTDDAPIWASSDFRLVRQILINLIDNAIKYTKTGTITVDISVDEAIETGKLLVSLSVKDTGTGMEFKEKEQLLTQLSNSEETHLVPETEGDLGLTLCRHFGSMLGGTWDIESTFGKGSVFTFSWLVDEVAPEEKAPTPHDMLKVNLNILVVEDNTINQMLMRNILEKWGHTIEVIRDGEQAIERIKGTLIYPDHTLPDLVLMDLELPGLSGIETTAAIRELSDQASTIPIIAVTANVSNEYREKCSEVGMNGFVGKPVNSQVLAVEIFRAMHLNK